MEVHSWRMLWHPELMWSWKMPHWTGCSEQGAGKWALAIRTFCYSVFSCCRRASHIFDF